VDCFASHSHKSIVDLAVSLRPRASQVMCPRQVNQTEPSEMCLFSTSPPLATHLSQRPRKRPYASGRSKAVQLIGI